MSVRVMTRVWDDARVGGSALLVLLALADNANDEGLCWPSHKTLCQKTRLSRQTLITYLKRLEQLGEILIVRRPGRSNRYVVLTGLEPQRRDELRSRYGITGGGGSIDGSYDGSLRDLSTPPVQPGVNPSVHPLSTRVDTPADRPTCFAVWEQEIGALTPHIADRLGEYLDDPRCPEGWIVDAIREASANNVRRLSYVEAILNRWLAQGRDKPRPAGGDEGPESLRRPGARLYE